MAKARTKKSTVKKKVAKKKSAAKKGPSPSLRAEADKLWYMYRKMSEIRLFEEHVWDVYTRGLMPGLAHLYIGEEAVAVGAASVLTTTISPVPTAATATVWPRAANSTV